MPGAWHRPGVVGVRWVSNDESPSAGQAPPPPPEKPRSVAGLGRIEPKDGILSLGVPTPDRIASFKKGLKEGAVVKKDETLAVLDSAALREQELKVAKLQLQHAQRRLEAIQASGNASMLSVAKRNPR